MFRNKLTYLASPYSHKLKRVRMQRYNDVTIAAAKLTEKGYALICPITTSHNFVPYMKSGNFGFKGFWERLDLFYISMCHEVVVLMLDGWKESVGVQAEIEYAKELGIPIKYTTMEKLK